MLFARQFPLLVAGACVWFAGATARANDAAAGDVFSAADLEFFEKQVRPILAINCQKCHGPEKQQGGLRLDSRPAILTGGDTGPAIVPGKPDDSLLIDAVGYGDLYQMPPSGKLPEADQAVLRRWVELNAPWPPGESGPEIAKPASSFDLDERAQHWCFQPLVGNEPPAVRDVAWPRSPVDQFVLAPMEAAGLAPAPPADRRTLLRRAYFDLIGLPPTPDALDSFLDSFLDSGSHAGDDFERLIDDLLASPHFGERWGRHWLDLVRYAESRGHEFDYTIPNAYQYRDYVIRAFNDDVAYDQFVLEHVAGDLLDPPRRRTGDGANESVLGTGFWFLGEEVHSPIDTEADELDRTDNKLDVFSKTFLALTVACARCHDHKFDAISTKDYYALSGFVLSSDYRQVAFEAGETQRQIAAELAEWREHDGRRVAQRTAAALRPTVERVSNLLLAARELAQAPAIAAGEGAEVAAKERLQAAAARHQVPADLLRAWQTAVTSAAGDTSSPLHPWAVVAGALPETTAAAAGAPPAPLLRPLAEQIRQQRFAADTVLREAKVIVDYSQLPAADWLTDGYVFGLRPVRTGEFRVGDPQRPIARLFERGAAVSDPAFDVATPAAGLEAESGRLSWRQAGRTLHTPSFTLSGGKLYYLVSGSGYAYASVHSHRLNNGPLHGALVREWQAGDQFQWIEQDLSAYPGCRVHIEFTPHTAGELRPGMSPVLAVAAVVEAEHAPAAVPGGGPYPAELLAEENLASIETLAAAYQRMFQAAAGLLASPSPAASSAQAALANWMVEHLDLFAPPNQAARSKLAGDVAPLLAIRQQLLDRLPRQVRTAPAMFEGSGVDQHVMLRGSQKTPGDVAPRRYLEVLAGANQPAIASGSGRGQLARQMVDASHPLVARVIVNRVWQHLFGRGIVASVDNFGVLGERPTHPELLDYLAGEFMRDGWSIKRLIRRLLLSATYQMQSRPSDRAAEIDPRNLLLSHAAVRRLEGEVVHDSILAVSGRLNERLFGPSVPIYLSEFLDGRGRPASGPLDGDGRRGVYLSVRRNFLNPFFLAFDSPVPATSVGRRGVSNVPAQALVLLNSPLVLGEARRWAERALGEVPASAERTPDEHAAAIVDRLYRQAFARLPSDDERRAAVAFVGAQSARRGGPDAGLRAWADLCHVLLNSKEFIFIE